MIKKIYNLKNVITCHESTQQYYYDVIIKYY